MQTGSDSRVTRRELVCAVLLFGLLVTLFLGGALLTGRYLSPADLLYGYFPWQAQAPAGWGGPSNGLLSDSVLVFEPWLGYTAARLHAGSLPLWNPQNMLGAPFIGNMQSAVFYPFNWLYFLWPGGGMLVARAWLKLFTAALGTYLLARQTFGIRPAGAILASLTFSFGGFVTVWLLYPHTNAVVLLPWLWWATARLVERPNPRLVVVLAVAVALTLVAGQPELAYYEALATAAFTLFQIARTGPLRPRRVSYLLGIWAAAYLLGALAAAIQLVPFLEYLTSSATLSLRANPAGPDVGFPLRYAWTAISPDMFGNPAHLDWWDPVANYNEMNIYCGIAPLLLAPFALFGRDRQRRYLALFLLVLMALALGIVYDWPVVRAALGTIPLLRLGATGRLAVFAEFALALLAGLGMDRLQECLPRERLRLLGALAVVALATLVMGVGLPAALAHSYFLLPTGLDPALKTWSDALTRSLVLISATAALIALLVLLMRPRLRSVALIVLPLLLWADLWQAHGGYNSTVAPAGYYPPTAMTQFLRAQPGYFRSVSAGWLLMPDTNLVYRLDDLGGYDALMPQSYYDTVLRIDPVLRPDYGYSPFHILQSRLLNLLNVRYLLLEPGDSPNYRPDVAQEALAGNVGEIQARNKPGQTFVATHDDLAQIQVFGATYGHHPPGRLIFHLKAGLLAQADIATQEVDTSALPDDRYWTFDFPPIADSKGRSFYFYLEEPTARSGQAVTIFYSPANLYPGGTRTATGTPARGDLTFRARYRIDPDNSWFAPVFTDTSGTVFENKQALTRAWLTHRAEVQPGAQTQLELLRKPEFDRAGTALLDAPLPVADPLPSAPPPAASDTVSITRYEPEHVEITADSPAAGLLILSDQAFPGWEAAVDGRAAPIITVDHALRGVYLTAGSHRVTFDYRPASFAWGAGLTGLGLLVALGLVAWPRGEVNGRRQLIASA
ncbi:MAG: YfhO family protein [Chloroflexia bacterium]